MGVKIRHEFQVADRLLQPGEVTGGFNVIPCTDSRGRVRIQEIYVVPITHYLAGHMRALLEPKLDGVPHQFRHRDAFRHYRGPKHVIGLEDQ